jgi:uncharacterized protein YydD (DUF2326 family)
MQLSQIYSNHQSIFAPIIFNSGVDAKILNVIFARVKRRKEREGDSHNLGKSTLIHLIDFLLLKDVSSGEHFLVKHADRFSDFVFFLELALHTGGFVTIRRTVSEPTKIAFKRSDRAQMDFRKTPQDEWDHQDIALASAIEMLDGYLDLRMIAPWSWECPGRC